MSKDRLSHTVLKDIGFMLLAEGKTIRVREASAVSMVVSNCIQHNYSPDMIARFLGSVSMMCSKVPVATLSFRPDRSIIEYILRSE